LHAYQIKQFTFTSSTYFEDLTLNKISGSYSSPHKPQQVCSATTLWSLMEEKSQQSPLVVSWKHDHLFKSYSWQGVSS